MYGGDFFPAALIADEADTAYIDFFQRDKRTRAPKGIIAIQLRGGV